MSRFLLVIAFLMVLRPSPARAALPPDRIASVIEVFLRWAIEGQALPADPPKPAPSIPHRSCGGQFDPEHLPAVVYVTWGLSAEGQHAACNWKYDVATHRAAALTPAEAAEVAQRIVAGSIPTPERAFFHAVPKKDGPWAVTAGYCWGSAAGTLVFRADGPVLIGELTIRGY
jgi:hypothetical protein